MDITPVYELKTRLRAAMIAGTNLLSEDFRLKKAAEGFAALSGSSPVFAKINAMTERLLSENSPECLLDTITLVDAVITTLGTAEVKGELVDLPDNGCSSVIVNAPYSRLSVVLDALTTSGGGQYNAFMEVKNNDPELLNDYRVKPALVKGLSASYSELADEVASTLTDMGKDMLPLLDHLFQILADILILKILFSISGCRHDLIRVSDAYRTVHGLRQAFRILLRQSAEFSDGRIFFQDDFPFPVSKDLQRIALADAECPADLLRNHNSAKIIYSAYNSCSFHILYYLHLQIMS